MSVTAPPVPLAGPDAFHLVAAAVLAGVVGRLDPAPGRACVVPGAIAWDACDCDGMVAVAVQRIYLSSSFPAEASTSIGSPCDAADLTAELRVEVLRCAPGPDEEGNPPTCGALEATARQLVTDAYGARLGAYCTLAALRRARAIEAFRVAAQPALGPEGGCVGTALGVTVAVLGGCGCDG